MALFQHKPVVGTSVPLYTIGSNKTIFVVGLGNPGQEYQKTRHNIGFAAVEEFAASNNFPAWIAKNDMKCQLAINTLGDTRVILCKPQTFMNNSGEAVQTVQHFYKIDNSQTLVVYDELDMDFGNLRSRTGGSDAGHNGVKSLIGHIGEDFNRLRVGIKNEHLAGAEAADFVLAKFSREEQGKLPEILREATAMVTEFVFGGLVAETRKVF